MRTSVPTSSPQPDATADEGRYLALKARDARFDGRFFTGVTSTGIYCRPVCAVRTPRRENCRFFTLAAQAESAGFRPCLRCRPELAPQALVWSVQDASGILVRQAVRLLASPDFWGGAAPSEGAVARLAARLGVSDRHLRRIFEATLGVSPLQYLQTQRLLAAKQLLADTALPITQVALASGFASVRRFNAAFATHYGISPTAVRRAGTARAGDEGALVRLGYRPPLDAAALLAFFAQRQIAGMEWVEPGEALVLRRTVRIAHAGTVATGWLNAQFEPARHRLVLQTSDSLHPVLPLVIARVRALLDLDADPEAINATLHAHFPHGDGLRVPGAFDGFELAVRAVLGQQITVAAARTLAQRLVERFGAPLATPWAQLTRLFPAPAVLAEADGDALGQLGIVRQRQAAIVALARAVGSGQLQLHSSADVGATTAQLCQLPGIGDWTAQYIAMRALRWPDAFPSGDVALHKALAVQGEKSPARAAAEASLAWQPWRSYAVIRAWAGSQGPAQGTVKLSNQ
ncbi:adenosine deaminase [Acidovorax sp. SRB_14]|uniref:DNA-3-methyladenine glycosylase 2 family protein n=1 Tax=Acidovorax sp. SRB_14 TaxID=1962699 RepID=UPI001563DDFA|nr:AlkA N-terminal domain-containing protein [Acidovorax sp. SRB_14]NMM79417.1 adenosine deaminase [Acidovorax sp. SRB_14]